MSPDLPAELVPVRDAARQALGPVLPATATTRFADGFFSRSARTDAGRRLPEHYLVYFLLVELLGFRHWGPEEKVAWTIPIDFQGTGYTIEHRKFGIGVFALHPEEHEADVRLIVGRICRATRLARPFFDWMAEKAVAASELNVVNNSGKLFQRLEFLLAQYRAKKADAVRRQDEIAVAAGEDDFLKWTRTYFPQYHLKQEADWLAIAAVEAFFSWTEHVFIHIGILLGKVRTGKEVGDLAGADWQVKFLGAFDLAHDPVSKRFYDDLVTLRRELRNFVAHGAFGKGGEALSFHSSTGAVPVLLSPRKGAAFRFGSGLDFDTDRAINLIDRFLGHVWAGDRAPARIYVQEFGLPGILTMVADGSYARAMASPAKMSDFAAHLSDLMDQASNMDW